QPRLADDGQRIVILDAELAAVVEGDGAAGEPVADLPALPRDQFHGLIPARLPEPPATTDQGAGQPVVAVIGLPAMEPLGAEPPSAGAVVTAAADADDPAALDADVEPASVGAEDAARLDPPLGLRDRTLVQADRPSPLADVGGPGTPDVLDAVARRRHGTLLAGTRSPLPCSRAEWLLKGPRPSNRRLQLGCPRRRRGSPGVD